jgi:hypothetical protein
MRLRGAEELKEVTGPVPSIPWSGAGLSPLGTLPTVWPIVLAPDDG